METKRCSLFFLYFLCLPWILFSDTNSSSTNIKEKYTKETIQFWDRTLRFGTTQQKKAVLETIRDQKIEAALDIVKDHLETERNLTVKKIMIEALVTLKDRSSIPYLITLLKDNSLTRDIHIFAMNALGLLKSEKSGDVILKFLDSPDIQLKETALRALGGIQYKPATPVVIKKLKEEENERVRTEMILTLVNIESEKSQDTLISILTNENEKSLNRQFAATGLSRIKNERSFAILSQYIERTDTAIKARITEALGTLGNKKAAMILQECLKDDDDVIRYYAALSLGKLKIKDALEILKYKKDYDPELKVRKASEKAIKQISGESDEHKGLGNTKN
ncbi:MAG: HEAT repeat domain-containing protein [Spirochaetes bacterium]|nr:HEAT repeat domain-containing protein [Spirochaetota bacterium]